MLRSTTARRISLLASSSLAASTLAAGLGGVAFTAFTPAVALAACSPTPATTTGPGAFASGVQSCGGNDAGVFYQATAGMTVLFVGETVTTNGVGVTAAGATNINLGVDTTTLTAGNIVSTSGAGIGFTTGSGAIEIDTGSTIGPNPGALVTGLAGITATTGGTGTVLINAYNNVTGTAGDGISVAAGSGNVTINA